MPSVAWRAAAAASASASVPDRYRPILLRGLGLDVGRRLIVRSGCHIGSARIRFGDDVFVNHRCFFDGDTTITIGDRVALGPDCKLITAGHSIGDRRRRCTSEPMCQAVTIEAGTWLAAAVTVLPGVTIASGCVIGAGAIVTNSTRADGLYVGVPARRIRDLP